MADVRFRLNRPKDKDGNDKKVECSILVTLYISDAIRPEISTKERVLPYDWNGKKVKKSHPEYDRINENLNRIDRELMQLWRDSISDLSQIRPKMELIVRGAVKSTEKKTLFRTFDAFLADYQSSKQPKTLGKYNSLLVRLKEFDIAYPISLETLDMNFFDAFKRFLYAIPNPNYSGHSLVRSSDGDYFVLRDDRNGISIGLFDDTVAKYFINLKTFLSWAEKRGHKVNPSYKLWEVKEKAHPPISLTKSELEAIEQKELPHHLSVARDYLVFECRTGQRISDIKAFNVKEFNQDKWTFTQKKTGRVVTVHFRGFCEPALWILQKYHFKFPPLSEQKLNKHIKTLCEKAGLTQEIYTERSANGKKIRIYDKKANFLSSHSGRKTFITLALQSGMPVEYVMQLTGISEYQTINHYKAEFEENSIKDYLEKMEPVRPMMKKAE